MLGGQRHTKKANVEKLRLAFFVIRYLFSPGLRMDVHENGKASRGSQHTLTPAATAAMLPW